jgi:hypothetical protein
MRRDSSSFDPVLRCSPWPAALGRRPRRPLPLLAPLSHGRAVELPAARSGGALAGGVPGLPAGLPVHPLRRILDYLEPSPRLAAGGDLALRQTYEGRPLTLLAISAAGERRRPRRAPRGAISAGRPGRAEARRSPARRRAAGGGLARLRRPRQRVVVGRGGDGRPPTSWPAAAGGDRRWLDDVVGADRSAVEPGRPRALRRGYEQRAGACPTPIRTPPSTGSRGPAGGRTTT